MSARRFSGACSIGITLIEEQASQIEGSPATYRVLVRDRESGDRAVVMVGHARHMIRAVDSPATYDEVARAGLSFVIEESRATGQTFTPDYEPDGTYLIDRSRRRSVG
jgi:hypothetical protein